MANIGPAPKSASPAAKAGRTTHANSTAAPGGTGTSSLGRSVRRKGPRSLAAATGRHTGAGRGSATRRRVRGRR
jgi:hypothetical protein